MKKYNIVEGTPREKVQRQKVTKRESQENVPGSPDTKAKARGEKAVEQTLDGDYTEELRLAKQ